MAAVVLMAAAAVVLLARSTSAPSPGEAARRAALSASATPSPPYDGRPGRTRIPDPTVVGEQLVGDLPATGSPGRDSASRAVGLVLGRYCLDPAAYAYPLGSESADVAPDWEHLSVAVFRIERGSSTPALMLTLEWSAGHYLWTGPVDLLEGC